MVRKHFRYLIIGNSAGGIGAAEAIRETDKEGSLAILSDEPYHTYSRPLISEYLAGERTIEGIYFRPADFYKQKSVQAILGKKAAALDLAGRLVRLESGEELTWERLLLACGGKPIVPPMKGDGLEGRFNFITLNDARKLRPALKKAKEAVVIGGGLIGISLTEALVKSRIKVTIVEKMGRVLGAIVDANVSRLEEARLKKAGVKVVTGHTVQEVVASAERPEAVGGVVLDNGQEITCQILGVAVGVSPRGELVEGTDIKKGRGIVVDRHMATSHPDVFACGDAAEAYDFVYGVARLTPIWPNAYIGGRVAGFNMAGKKAVYPGGTVMNSLGYFGLPIASAGLFDPPEGNGYEALSHLEGETYRKVILKDGRIAGMAMVSDIGRAGIIFGLMREGVNVSSFKEALLSDEFSLPRCQMTCGREGSARNWLHR
ncbi:MAG: FAD-dependent oxidoreductase [Dehalococcoidia bacterium]|nr:FAD-dependent oxidoreductase [Dehalococcoidia bacterium]